MNQNATPEIIPGLEPDLPAPRVSALIITYNHKPFIAQAIESALMQQTNFDFEIVVGDDCSTDGTREIVIDCQKRHPGKIRAILHEKNLGHLGKLNFAHGLKSCRGQYIAGLEGDDYWISPHKLQLQADFLDAHPECSTCYHNAYIESEDSPGRRDLFYTQPPKTICGIDDLLEAKMPPGASVTFRRGLFGDFPDWFYDAKMGDLLLHTLNSVHGTFGYVDEIMSVYRVHRWGAWSTKTLVERSLEEIKAFELIDAFLKGRHHQLLSALINQRNFFLARGYDELSDTARAREFLRKYLAGHHRYPTVTSREIFRLFLKIYLPGVFRLLKGARDTLKASSL